MKRAANSYRLKTGVMACTNIHRSFLLSKHSKTNPTISTKQHNRWAQQLKSRHKKTGHLARFFINDRTLSYYKPLGPQSFFKNPIMDS